jgi:ribosomal protein L32
MLVAACALLVLAAGVFVLAPLFREPKGNLEVELLAETELDRLLSRKTTVYGNLKELEFEYHLGRLSESDFKRLEAGYRAEAALVLRQLDSLGVEKHLDEAIEKDVAARRARRGGGARAAAHEAARCPSCGAEAAPGKRFCADCGHRLS